MEFANIVVWYYKLQILIDIRNCITWFVQWRDIIKSYIKLNIIFEFRNGNLIKTIWRLKKIEPIL